VKGKVMFTSIMILCNLAVIMDLFVCRDILDLIAA